MGKQMIRNGGAQPLTSTQSWKSINWKKAQREVRRLQMRIAKVVNARRVQFRKENMGECKLFNGF